MLKILLIEDEPKVAAFICQGLSEQHYRVAVAYDDMQATALFCQGKYDLIIIDILLPHKNGIELCREFRRVDEEVPILMLTALGTPEDKVRGFDSGADDYLVKPFHFKELLARIGALTRRGKRMQHHRTLTFADLELDKRSKRVRRDGRDIPLTAKEFALLELFLQHPEEVLSRTLIAENVWEFDTGTNVIDVYINYLRNKIEKGFSGRLIHTVIGMGYVLRKDDNL